MAIHAPITGAPTRALSFRRRKTIETEIETLLARVEQLLGRLDRADGDCDLEDDDPPGDILDRGEAPGDNGAGIMRALPIYAEDQRSGPINYAIVSREHYAAEAGIVRSASGGWTHSARVGAAR